MKQSNQKNLHLISLKQLCSKLDTSLTDGLTQKKAAQNLTMFGENIIPLKQKIHPILRFFKEITNWFSILLWVGAILAITIYLLQPEGNQSQLYLAVSIIAIILITGTITYLQTAKSQEIMQKFKDMLPPNCSVIRSGQQISLPASKLVKGDLVLTKMGQRIPADIRIIASLNMKVDNSSITGETALLLKKVDQSSKNMLQSSNVAFLGTYCRHGKGRGIVIATGKDTYLSTIANLTFQQKKEKSPLQQQLDKFVFMITILACSLGLIFIMLGKFVIGYTILQCMVLGIGIIVANVPQGILACVTISLAITAKKLAAKNVLVKNLQSVETLGSTSCICSDKTGTLTMNKMTVKHLWIGEKLYARQQQKNIQGLFKADKDFRQLVHCSVLSSEAKFEHQQSSQQSANLSVIGDASQTALIKFCKHFQNVHHLRNFHYQTAKDVQGNNLFLSFNSQLKYSFGVYNQVINGKSNPFKIYLKGAPQKVWKLCSKIRTNGKDVEINKNWTNKFQEINYKFADSGERVLGFAIKQLDSRKYPHNHKFISLNGDSQVSNQKEIQMSNFIFLGVISLEDPPKPNVKQAIEKCKASGVKVIMLTGDQSITALSIGKKIGMITLKTNVDLQRQGYSQAQAMQKANALSISGQKIQALLKDNHQSGIQMLKVWISKPQIIFSRTTPVHKLHIVQACQELGYIVGVTGDGVNDAPAIKQASIGISMGISGSDITKDAADMVLLDDDFSSIIEGIEEGRKIFDNLKKTIVYILTSNITQVLPFIFMVIFRMPLPISSIFMLVISVGTDIYPAIALAYEQPQLDIMTRKPRKSTQRLVSIRMMTHAYGQLGFIATAAGMFNYIVIMEIYGFPIQILLFLLNKSGLVPLNQNSQPDLKFNRIIQYDSTLQDLGNPFLPLKCSNATFSNKFPTWVRTTNNRYDLRSAYLTCCPSPNQQLYCSIFNWPTNVVQTISPVTNSRVAFTTQSLFYAQSGYFAAVVLVQWLNIFACKTRKLSFIYSGFNIQIFIGILIQTVIMLLLLQVPHVYNIFGGRPLNIILMGIPGLPFAMLLLSWQQIRKYLVKNNNWFSHYISW